MNTNETVKCNPCQGRSLEVAKLLIGNIILAITTHAPNNEMLQAPAGEKTCFTVFSCDSDLTTSDVSPLVS